MIRSYGIISPKRDKCHNPIQKHTRKSDQRQITLSFAMSNVHVHFPPLHCQATIQLKTEKGIGSY